MAEQREIVEVLREGAKAYSTEVGGGHSYRYTRAADEIERLRAALETIASAHLGMIPVTVEVQEQWVLPARLALPPL